MGRTSKARKVKARKNQRENKIAEEAYVEKKRIKTM